MISGLTRLHKRCTSIVWWITAVLSAFVFSFVLYQYQNLQVSGNIIQVSSPVEAPVSVLYVITPTYDRPTQIPDLLRLTYTLMHVDNLHWIVVEDGIRQSEQVNDLLINSKISHTYLSVKDTSVNKHLKGMAQRNKALSWIRLHHQQDKNGVFYFADDDNVYSLELFKEMRKTQKISVWPVGFTGGVLIFQTPIVEKGKVVGFYSWAHDRKIAIDMAGFAINVKVLFDYPDMIFPHNTKIGFMETTFLEQCCTLEDLEPRADNCTKVLVWHLRTEKPKIDPRIKNIEWNVTKLIDRLNLDLRRNKRKNDKDIEKLKDILGGIMQLNSNGSFLLEMGRQ